ncbi:MAG: hypothetical protein HF560_04625 [Synechococcus sp. MIT S9220]|nr:hypothetical protein [Synechococcus sp. MIT S9220]
MDRPSSLSVFATVAGSGVLGLLIYAGFFYANLRRTSSIEEPQELRPSYSSQAQAKQEAERWITEGGTFTVTTTQRVRKTIPLTRQERRKLELLADEKRRGQIEADFEACLDQAATDLAKELCSFQQLPPNATSTATGADGLSDLPTTKVIEDVRVETSQRPRRTCTPVSSYRRFNCIEFDVARDEQLTAAQQNSLDIKGYRQFRY